ncbi:stage III sporulation protein AG [Alkalihalobacillus sp. AL-G]|uniref:stage III sporulation protein AG n=1 Tax=Alkalihalobacillus sp. AL-G TaxID=2926399 RepID=UPI00272B073C|nr:stage III sporulation protein AG [Alkalihalobacillus sp. AL-G]WLD91997.1 stage III sporulation protein AG [Alkalihalobacillus sp. AL-G]
MSEKNKYEWLKSILSPSKDAPKRSKKSQYILIVLGLGVAMMLVQNLFETPDTSSVMNVAEEDKQKTESTFSFKKANDPSSIRAMENHYENQLKELLDEMVGVKDALVVVTLDSTVVKVFEKDVNEQTTTTDETDQHGGKRKSTTNQSEEKVVIIQDENGEHPIIVTTEMPEVRGVAVVADGVENLQVKQWVREVVTRVFDVPSHNVSVMPKKLKGE